MQKTASGGQVLLHVGQREANKTIRKGDEPGPPLPAALPNAPRGEGWALIAARSATTL